LRTRLKIEYFKPSTPVEGPVAFHAGTAIFPSPVCQDNIGLALPRPHEANSHGTLEPSILVATSAGTKPTVAGSGPALAVVAEMALTGYPTWTVFAALAVAIVVDGLAGDPRWLYGRLAHPVVIIGRTIGWLDHTLNRGAGRRWKGAAAVFAVTAAAIAIGFVAHRALDLLSPPVRIIVEGAVASVFLAQRGLYDHVRAVAAGLERDGLAGGRAAVAHLVGRDPGSLDEAGVCRAATESLAENFGDGVIAPVFWYVLFGLPGIIAYKAINTADSMIGHRTERHRDFGWAAAWIDDGANWLPARLTGLLLALAALPMPGASIGRAWAAMMRDAGKHTSPNAGWPEAAMAGALDLALAGPRRYGDRTIDGAWMGDGRADLSAGDIRRALVLYGSACLIVLAMATAAAILARAT
jgi:adenosylcobinamide-phosphate synthase